MTYDEITETLHAHNCGTTASALDNAVREEACKLIDNGNSWGNYKNNQYQRMRIPNEQATEAAREFYATDITDQLRGPQQHLTPEKVLDYRRLAVAWAVAEVLRTCGGLLKACVKCGRPIPEPMLDGFENERCKGCAD